MSQDECKSDKEKGKIQNSWVLRSWPSIGRKTRSNIFHKDLEIQTVCDKVKSKTLHMDKKIKEETSAMISWYDSWQILNC